MDDSEHEYKMRFATSLQRVPREQRLTKASVVAKQLLGKDAVKFTNYVLKIADEWPHDPVVIAEIDRLDLIPLTREQVLRQVLDLAIATFDSSTDKRQAWKLYSEIAGYVGTTKEPTSNNELLTHLQALHSAVTNPVDT
jgi:pterin-4a-carbinolamine dehydratase